MVEASAQAVALPPLVVSLHSPELRLRLSYLGAEMADPLQLVQGSVAPVRIELRDSKGPETVPPGTRATLAILDDAGGTVLSRDTAAGNLVQQASPEEHVFVATLDQTEADALPTGIFVGQLNLEFASGWITTQRWYARILPGLAPTLP